MTTTLPEYKHRLFRSLQLYHEVSGRRLGSAENLSPMLVAMTQVVLERFPKRGAS